MSQDDDEILNSFTLMVITLSIFLVTPIGVRAEDFA